MAGYPDPEIKGKGGAGGGAVSKNVFRSFGPQFGLKFKGGPGPSPGSTTATYPIGSMPHFGAV